MISPGFVCLSVFCLFVCEQDNSKTYGRILINFSGYVRNGKGKKREEVIRFGSGSGSLSGSSGSMKCNFKDR